MAAKTATAISVNTNYVTSTLYAIYLPSTLLLWVVAVAGVATPIYQTKHTEGGGWTTSLWQSCMQESGNCRTIDASLFPCASLGNLLRTARAFIIMAILSIAAQFIVAAVGFFSAAVGPKITRTTLVALASISFLLLLIGAACCAALYTLPQCQDHPDRMAAANVDFVTIGPSVPLLFSVTALELLLALGMMFLHETPSGDKYKDAEAAAAAAGTEDDEQKKKPAAATPAAASPATTVIGAHNNNNKIRDAGAPPGARRADGK